MIFLSYLIEIFYLCKDLVPDFCDVEKTSISSKAEACYLKKLSEEGTGKYDIVVP